nr:GTP-binding protein [Herbihabitans rhizosphaerae]
MPRAGTDTLATELSRAEPGTVVVHHDLREISHGVVRRRLRHGSHDMTTVLELAHGCVSCTLREDLLPLLRKLIAADGVRRIVVHLDPSLEPEAVCWALDHVVVGDSTITDLSTVDGVLTVVDESSWLADATGDAELAERGLGASPDDDRSIAQVAVGQVEFADVVLLTGAAPSTWDAARTGAVLDRLAPAAPRARLSTVDASTLLGRVPEFARRGRIDDAHGPLLRGEPPLEPDCGVAVTVFRDRRPFHPERLHQSIDALLDGVVRTRGRMWVASQPDVALWLESAGGGLRVGHAGAWLAAVSEDAWRHADPERVAKASLDWDPYYGDRIQELVIVSHLAEPEQITATLRAALLTDDELAEGETAWRGYPDPFGSWHQDPCDTRESDDDPLSTNITDRTGRDDA